MSLSAPPAAWSSTAAARADTQPPAGVCPAGSGSLLCWACCCSGPAQLLAYVSCPPAHQRIAKVVQGSTQPDPALAIAAPGCIQQGTRGCPMRSTPLVDSCNSDEQCPAGTASHGSSSCWSCCWLATYLLQACIVPGMLRSAAGLAGERAEPNRVTATALTVPVVCGCPRLSCSDVCAIQRFTKL